MASENDGSIIIDTELDNTGFEKGSDKLTKAIAGMENAFDNLGDNMMDSFNKVVPLLQSIADSASQINSKLIGTATQTEAASERMVSSEERASAAVKNTARAFSEQEQSAKKAASAMTANQYDAALAKVQAQIDKAKSKLSDYYKELAEIRASTDEMLAQSETDQQAANVLEIEEQQIDRLNKKYEAQLSALQKLEAEYARLSKLKASAGTAGAQFGETVSIKSLEAELDKVIQKIDQYEAKVAKMQEVGATDKQWETIKYDIDQAKQKLSEFQEKLSSLHSSGAIPQGEFERLSVAIAAALGKQEALTRSLKPNVWAVFTDALKKAASAALRLAKNLAKVAFRAVGKGVSFFVGKLKGFIQQSKETNKAVKSLTKSLTSLKTLLIARIKYTFISAIFNDAKANLQELAKFSDSFNRSMSNIKNSAKGLSANLSVSMGSLISAVEPAITRLINILSKATSYLNAFFAMLRGKSTVTVAKKQTASYAESLSDAAGSAKKLRREIYGFDELNRQSSEDSGSGGDTGGAASDLFEEVPIDSLLPDSIKDFYQRLIDAAAAEDWQQVGSIIAEGLNAGMHIADDWINNTFRPMGVKWAGNIAEVLNGLTADFEWDFFGKTIADGLNSIVDIYNTFMDTYNFEKLGEGLGDALNNFVDNAEWENIGKAFAQDWRALIETIYGIVSITEFDDLGQGIGLAIMGWFDTIPWVMAADTLVLGINGIFEALQNTIDTMRWDDIATTLHEAVTHLITGIEWAKIGATLGDLITHLLNTFNEVVTQKDWYAVGKGIGDLLSALPWLEILSGFGTALWNAFSGVISGLFDTSTGKVIIGIGAGLLAIKGLFASKNYIIAAAVIKWVSSGVSPLESMPTKITEIGGKVKTAFSDIASAIKEVTPVIGQAALGVFDTVMIAYDAKSLIDAGRAYNDAQLAHNHETETALNSYSKLYQEKGKEVADEWAKMVYEIDTTNMNFDQAQQAISEKIEGYWDDVPQNMWDGFKQGWNSYFGEGGSGLFGLLGDAFTGAIDGINKLLGINSPSTVFAEIGGFLIEGLFQGISDAWEAITTFFSTALPNLKETLFIAFEDIKTKISDTWDAVKTKSTEIWDGIKTGLTETWGKIKDTATKKWDSIKTTVTDKFEKAKNTLSDTADNVKTKISDVWEDTKTATSEKWEFVKKTSTELFDGAKKLLIQTAEGIFLKIGEKWDHVNTTARDKWKTIQDTVTRKWDDLKEILSRTDWKSIGSNICSGIKNGIESGWHWLTSTVSSLASSLLSTAKSALGISSPSKLFKNDVGRFIPLGLAKGIEDTTPAAIRAVKNLAEETANGFETEKATLQIDAAGDGLISRLDIISDKLLGIASVFQGIGAYLGQVGDLRIPYIATGEAVPYKTRISDSIADASQERFNALMEDVVKSNVVGYEAVVNVLKDILEALLGIEIGDDVIGRAAARYSRRMSLITGGG